MIRDKLEFPRVITNSITKYTLLAIRCQVGKNDERKNILNKKKKVSWKVWKKTKNKTITTLTALFYFTFRILITFSQQYVMYIEMFACVLMKKKLKSPGFEVINTAVNTSVSGYVMSFEFTQPASMYT